MMDPRYRGITKAEIPEALLPGEPVAWYGPIVMNTREELRVAFEELSNGTFIKQK